MSNDRNDQTILLAEDEPEVRNYLEMALRCQGYGVESVQDGEEALSFLKCEGPVSALLLDIVMPRKDGLETLREIRLFDRETPIIMVSGAASPLNVVEAMKNGATDFVVKPVNHEELIALIRRTLEKPVSLDREPCEAVALPGGKQGFFGTSAAMRELVAMVSQVGWSEEAVLIQGETGSGKEVIARRLHALSPRAGKPFFKLNCAALPSKLVESELFGYERGAFTGAFQRKPGMFELADGGALMLDEIGEMDYNLQAKLLTVLQDQEFHRLGGKEIVRVNVRVIAATHNDLEQAILDNKFRADLYCRLNVINLRVPPLRDRSEDIAPLAEFLLRKHAPAGAAIPAITPALRQALLAYRWPGNVGELENYMRKLNVIGKPDVIARDLQALIARRSGGPGVRASGGAPILEQVSLAKQQAETEAILAALETTHWNRKKAASLLEIDYKALLYKMKKLAIEDRQALMPAAAEEPGSDPETAAASDD